ncbi:hypothetical protein JKP88DRAFT_237546, partial [Tribonema minus]
MAALTALRSAGSRVGSLVMCAMRAAAAVAFLSADMFFECEPHNKPSTLDATVLCTACHVQAHFRFHTGTLNAQPPEDLVDRRLEVSTINMPSCRHTQHISNSHVTNPHKQALGCNVIVI